MTANDITARLLNDIPRLYPFIRLWRNNRLTAPMIGKGGKIRRVSAGVNGQADISGIIGQSAIPVVAQRLRDFAGRTAGADTVELLARLSMALGGRRIEIEVKAGRDRMRPAQEAFRNMITAHGGLYLVARTVEGCLAEMDDLMSQTSRPRLATSRGESLE